METIKRLKLAKDLIQSAIESDAKRTGKGSYAGSADSKTEIYQKLKIARKELLDAMKDYEPNGI